MRACLVTDLEPLSVGANVNNKRIYKSKLVDEFNNQGVSFEGVPFSTSLYSKIIYIHLKKTALDVDNMSKLLVDAFKGTMYVDDDIINHRVCSKISFYDINPRELNITILPKEIFVRFDKYIAKESKHILYYEIGDFSESMVYVGGERNETR